ncbi:methylated-DNA--[protein]-cysteine S-methyltransferase [Winogradskya humida]|uniref:methylated-DNA--[protein]-cysteine S-methyltransferase n=1 Tax=Winogradskya humida TaxID=113566 RepID=UPI001943402D|nr:methylated-DNA--[protein]-cysteine S-methyltransferase [Actinoplanes humidus]
MRLVVDSPIGPLGVELDGLTVIGVRFGASPVADLSDKPAVVEQLEGYFAGTVTEFTVPISMRGGSSFERFVWAEIAKIPYGETRTYGDIAKAFGDVGAARAVGTACNRNPVPVLVPCHRVVGAGNKLVGFGGGLPRKRQLLELEARVSLERAWGFPGASSGT